MEYYDGFYHRDFRHYWLPYNSPYQQPVLVAHVPIPGRSVTTSRFQTSDENLQKCRGIPKWKSKATKLRDSQRKQKFMECKSIISSFPFFGLDNDEFRKEAVNDVKPRETQMSTKLTAAEKTIKQLQKRETRIKREITAHGHKIVETK